MSHKKIKVVQQVLDPSGSGGVSAEYRALKQSGLNFEYEFEPMILMNPHNGLNIKDIYFYYKFLIKSRPDIVHIRGAAPDGLNAVIASKLSGKCKTLVSVHGMYSDLVYINPIKKKISYHIIEKLIFALADGISCVCKNANDRKRFDRYRKKMLPFVYNRMPDYNGMNKNLIRTQIRKKLNIDNTTCVGIYVGRITKEKGMEYLKSALENANEDMKFLIVGDGQYLDDFKTIEKKNIVFLGNQSDVYQYLFASDFFALPSLHENHSIALLEAAAAGLPIIATNVGGNNEIVQDNVTGILIPPKNYKALSDAINDLYNNTSLRERFKEAIMQLEYEQFKSNSVDMQLRYVYQNIMK